MWSTNSPIGGAGPRWLQASNGVAATVALAVMLALLVAGCGDSESNDSASETAAKPAAGQDVSASVADSLPEDLRSAGKLRVAIDATYPPLEYVDEADQTIKGIDPDLIDALGGKLGLEVELIQAKFDGILPGLQAKKYDAAISGFADRKEREEIVDFVTYMRSGEAFFVNAELDAAEFDDLSDLCGHTIAVLQGTENARQAYRANKSCGGNVTVREFPDQNAATLAVTSGRADLSSAFGPVATWIVDKSGGRLKMAGTYSNPVPLGIAVSKDSPELSQALLAALKELIDEGEYLEIMEKWHTQDFAITDPVINGAID